ncbi:hypothetical protein L2750_16315 [Shewanella submarina]|uniref:DUF2569 domain-containing protein n=1 Tax=Shewanella submarina TaxID=2016376 RepID=A0ABV7GCA5_9GAMM|nr:hypothetical protein [Shewanella submarina]MCL1038694.1 hypothetical protein [Shewanella submarina]
MIGTRVILMLAALLLMTYPLWGLLQPQSYLNELLETYPQATEASDGQIRQSSLILWLSNGVLAAALVMIARFIGQPHRYRIGRFGAALIGFYPLVLSISEVFIGLSLTSHLQDASVALELNASKLFYLVFAVMLFGIIKSQQQSHHTRAAVATDPFIEKSASGQ